MSFSSFKERWLLHWQALALAIQFLTTVPMRTLEMNKSAVGLSLLYYPLVGFLIALALLVLAKVGVGVFTPLLLAALLVAFSLLITGALHLDGLADCADAWVGGFGSRERTLEIMKDPRSGPVAISVIVMVMFLKVAATAQLIAASELLPIVLAPVLGRLSILVILLSTPYVREQGLGEILARHFPRSNCKLVVIVALTPLLLSGFLQAFFLFILLAVALFLLRRSMLIRVGGCTGDTLGASVELVELACLLGAIVLL